MNEITKIILGNTSWSFLRFLTVLAAIGSLIGGFVLTVKGIAGGGIIDLSMTFLHGKLQTGSVGLLFSFLGFVLLLPCLLSRVTSKLNVSRGSDGSIKVIHKGVFGKEKADSIVRLFEIEDHEQEDSQDGT